jgi:hypothetical protein
MCGVLRCCYDDNVYTLVVFERTWLLGLNHMVVRDMAILLYRLLSLEPEVRMYGH